MLRLLDKMCGLRLSLLLGLTLLLGASHGQHSVAHDDAAVKALHRSNPYFSREMFNASTLEELVFGVDAADAHPMSSQGCSLDVQLAWTTNLGASLYSTPHIVPAGAQGGREVWVNAFVRFAEAVRGFDGHELPGWPYAFGQASFHAR